MLSETVLIEWLKLEETSLVLWNKTLLVLLNLLGDSTTLFAIVYLLMQLACFHFFKIY